MTALLYSISNNPLAVIDFDATLGETHACSAAVTEHPQESGAAITDGAVPNNPRVTVEVMITNSPLTPSDLWIGGSVVSPWKAVKVPTVLQGYTTRMTQTARVKGGVTSNPFSDYVPHVPFMKTRIKPITTTPALVVKEPVLRNAQLWDFVPQDRVALIYNELRKIVDGSIEVQLVTRLTTYPRMMIEKVHAPIQQPNDSIVFTLDLVAIKTALVSIVTVTKKAAPAVKAVEENQDQGSQPTDFGLDETDREKIKSDTIRMAQVLAGGSFTQ